MWWTTSRSRRLSSGGAAPIRRRGQMATRVKAVRVQTSSIELEPGLEQKAPLARGFFAIPENCRHIAKAASASGIGIKQSRVGTGLMVRAYLRRDHTTDPTSSSSMAPASVSRADRLPRFDSYCTPQPRRQDWHPQLERLPGKKPAEWRGMALYCPLRPIEHRSGGMRG
jgi:hypothetical protein